MADIYSKAKRSEIMAKVKTRRTAPEEKVGALLRRLRVRYKRNVGSLPGSPDFIIATEKLAVFVHGCFWHGHKNCNRAKLPSTNSEFWTKKISGNIRRDRRNERLLRKEGWRVVTIWQCRLRKPESVSRRLGRFLLS